MISYNDYEFDDKFTNMSCSINVEYDTSERVDVARKIQIHVRSIITPKHFPEEGISTALHVAEIRDKLSVPGKTLIIDDIGFGPRLEINPPEQSSEPEPDVDKTYDIAYGPKPRVIKFVPLGAENAAEIEWQIDAIISPCQDSWSGVKEFSFSENFSINEKGFTTRTVTGQMTMSANSVEFGKFIDVENYRHKISVPLRENYRRSREYNVSEDKLTLRFKIVDKEIESPNAYPPGVVDIDAKMRTNSRLLSSSLDTANTIVDLTATIELAQNQPRARAYLIFNAILDEKINAILVHAPTVGIEANKAVMFQQFSTDEELFGNTLSFSIRFIAYLRLKDFAASGVLAQKMGDDWFAWYASMTNVHNRRGLAGMYRFSTGELPVNLCEYYTDEKLSISYYSRPTIPPPSPVLFALCNQTPTPEQSWVEFEAYLKFVVLHENELHEELGSITLNRQQFNVANPSGSISHPAANELKKVVSSGSEKMFLIWSGKAMRGGYPIPQPDLTHINGVELIPTSAHDFVSRKIGELFCVNTYVAAWNMVYRVLEYPGDTMMEATLPS